MPVISGRVKWCSPYAESPNTSYEPKWCVDVILDETSEKFIRDCGLGDKIKTDKAGDTVITIYRKVETAKGKKRSAPKVLAKNGTDFTEPIGNGSLCRVQFRVDEWDYKGKSDTRADFQGILVEEHVPYGTGDGSELAPYVDPDAPLVPDGDDVPF